MPRTTRQSKNHAAPRAPMSVEVRAVILVNNLVVAHRERQLDGIHLSIPGGRLNRGEGVMDALERELLEELGVPIAIGSLVYVAEVMSHRNTSDLNLFFAGTPAEPSPVFRAGVCELIDPGNPGATVLPPILSHIKRDLDAGWPPPARWLGNLWEASNVAASQ